MRRESEVPGLRCARWGGEEFVLAYLTDGSGTMATLITEADHRLYKGKESTGNCVVFE